MPTRIRLDAATTASTLFADPKDIPERLLLQLDAVFILGGGRPASWDQPPVYVKQRCDDAASVVLRRKAVLFRMYNKSNDAKNENNLPDISPSRQTEAQKRNIRDLPILCLSAGTPHLPQLMDAKHGLPIWEATASASYLALNHNMTRNVFVETASYDTIGNAFYARATHTDIVHWNKLLIVTNEVPCLSHIYLSLALHLQSYSYVACLFGFYVAPVSYGSYEGHF